MLKNEKAYPRRIWILFFKTGSDKNGTGSATPFAWIHCKLALGNQLQTAVSTNQQVFGGSDMICLRHIYATVQFMDTMNKHRLDTSSRKDDIAVSSLWSLLYGSGLANKLSLYACCLKQRFIYRLACSLNIEKTYKKINTHNICKMILLNFCIMKIV